MKKTLILVFALVALCLLASCDPNKTTEPEKKVIENSIFLYGYDAELELNDGTTKKILTLDEKTAKLQIWTKGINQTVFSKEPDVTFTGTFDYDEYKILVRDTDSYIEYTETTCGTLKFTNFEVPEDTIYTAKESYKQQMDLYSGSFDFDPVSGYKKYTHEDGSWAKELNWLTKGAIINFVVTQHPRKDTNQSLVIANGWKQI